jgi:hypothetical protein
MFVVEKEMNVVLYKLSHHENSILYQIGKILGRTPVLVSYKLP